MTKNIAQPAAAASTSTAPIARPVPVAIPTLELPRVLLASGALLALGAELDALGVSRPLLVTDQGLVAAGLVATTVSAMGADARPVLFDSVTENPLYADVDRGAALYARERCDSVVALGGGSVLDTAKLIALLATNTGSVAEYVGVPGVAHRAGAPLIAIPTTAGTGSEASPSAGLHPDATAPSVGMRSRHLVPRLAILDPDLTRSLPRRLVAATGIDALSHCIEGYLSNLDLPLGKAIALDGIGRIARHLRRAVADPQDVIARSEMMAGAFAGGVAIGMGLGPAHAIAIACSDQGFHHGMLSGIGIVATLDATAARCPERVDAAARAFGLGPSESLAQAVGALMRELGLPTALHALPYAAADRVRLAEAAHRSHFNLHAPYHPTAADYGAMLADSLDPPQR
jgi:4-hydroxybutyrate dehydrogenase